MDTLLLGKCLQYRTVLSNLLADKYAVYQKLTGIYMGGGLTSSEFLHGVLQVIKQVAHTNEQIVSIIMAHNDYIGRLLLLVASISSEIGTDTEPDISIDNHAENYDSGPKICCGMFVLSPEHETEVLESLHKKKAPGTIKNSRELPEEIIGMARESMTTLTESRLLPNDQYLIAHVRDYAFINGIKSDGILSSDIWDGLERLLIKFCQESNEFSDIESFGSLLKSNHAI